MSRAFFVWRPDCQMRRYRGTLVVRLIQFLDQKRGLS
jgi:hypothetical protein